jgi:predicted Zn finger-like uncharacterized protein
MSLATRCPACGTVFRVVSDQLKVSEGWVRCGRCSDVFNAAQRLFELEHEEAAVASPPQRAAAEVHRLPVRDPVDAPDAMARVSAALAPPSALAPSEPQAAVGEEPAQPLARTVLEHAEHAPPAPSADAACTEPAAPAQEPLAGTEVQPQADALRETPRVDEPGNESVPDVAAELAAPAPAPAPTPEFIRRAEHAARWRHPARRGLLAAAALLLVALLGGQIALHYRDHVAAAWPDTQPWLQAACNLLGCRIEAPRRIDSLSVDSSGLVRLPDSPLYRLSLVLRNKAATAVQMPAIDLALTDSQGQTMARRVLTAAELGHPADKLPAGGEITLQAALDLGERRVAGYTVELFYP